MTPADRQEILALAEILPAVWTASTTTPADRKHILRLLIDTVILDQRREPGKVWFQINWRTGATSEHWLIRSVGAYTHHAYRQQLEDRIRALNAAQTMDEEIATALSADGLRTAWGRPFTDPLIYRLRKQWGIPAIRVKATPTVPLRWEDGAIRCREQRRPWASIEAPSTPRSLCPATRGPRSLPSESSEHRHQGEGGKSADYVRAGRRHVPGRRVWLGPA